MYRDELPKIDEFVMVKIDSVDDLVGKVSLLEYNGKEAVIFISDLSRKRIKSVSNHIRVGHKEVLQVLRVDKDKSNIDLSKKNVNDDDISACIQKYKKSKIVHTILGKVSIDNNCNLLDLYTGIGWPLYDRYGHAYDAFTHASMGESIFNEIDISENIKNSIMKLISHHFSRKNVKVYSEIQVTCFSYEGIDAIKESIMEGIKNTPIKAYLKSSPDYVLCLSTLDPDSGIQIINNAIEKIQTTIRCRRGDCSVKEEPRVI